MVQVKHHGISRETWKMLTLRVWEKIEEKPGSMILTVSLGFVIQDFKMLAESCRNRQTSLQISPNYHTKIDKATRIAKQKTNKQNTENIYNKTSEARRGQVSESSRVFLAVYLERGQAYGRVCEDGMEDIKACKRDETLEAHECTMNTFSGP